MRRYVSDSRENQSNQFQPKGDVEEAKPREILYGLLEFSQKDKMPHLSQTEESDKESGQRQCCFVYTCASACRSRVWKGKISHSTRRSQKQKRVAESTTPFLRLTPS